MSDQSAIRNPQSAIVNVLLVDDQEENLLALEAVLDGLGLNLVKALSGREALKHLLAEDFAAILLDVQMPEMNGFETATLIRAREKSRHTPIIFITAVYQAEEHMFKGYLLGAVDYILKPFVPEILRSKVMVFVDLFRQARALERSEAALRQLNEMLEQRVEERTAKLAQRARSMALTADVGIALTQSTSLPHTLQQCTEALMKYLDAVLACLWTFNAEENVLELQASARTSPHLACPHTRVPMGEFKIGLVAAERQPHLTNALFSDPSISDPEWAKREGIVAFAGYPLIVESRLTGVAAVFARQPLPEATLQAMSSVATSIALGIERFRAMESLSDSTRRLQDALTELKATQRQIVQQERLRALGQMASGVAHDFNNALSPIVGYTELLLMFPDLLNDREKVTEYLRVMSIGAQDAANVVSRLREFYRQREEGEIFQPVDLNQLVEQAVMLTQPKWKDQTLASGKTIHIETDLQGIPPLMGNVADLREALTNLIFNAVDAMSEGGIITIRTIIDGMRDEG